jgi:hypothetical protein
MALGSGIWLLVTGLISIWIGSWVAGRLSGGPLLADGMLHGIVSWCVSTLAMFYLLATAVGAVIGGAGALVGGAMSQQNVQSIESPVALLGDEIKAMFPQAGKLLPPTGRAETNNVPGQLTQMASQDSDLAGALTRLESHGGATNAPQDRDQVIAILTSRHNLSQQDAANLLNDWDRAFQQAHAQAAQKADEAAHGVSQGALWGFIALILGLAVAAWGGWTGVASLPRPLEVQPAPA